MKLGISNIAVGDDIGAINSLDCDGIELAVGLIPIGEIEKEVIGLHALMYNNDWNIFRDTIHINGYIEQISRMCNDLNGKYLVFGSPKNRRIDGMSRFRYKNRAIKFFRQCAKTAEDYGLYFLIEPLPKSLTNFINDSDTAVRLIDRIHHEHFRLHLDIGAMLESKEHYGRIFNAYGDYIKHVHVNDFLLKPPMSKLHEHVGVELKESGYDGYVSIEMKKEYGMLDESIEYVRECYI